MSRAIAEQQNIEDLSMPNLAAAMVVFEGLACSCSPHDGLQLT